MFSIVVVLLLIVGGKLAGLSVSINNIKDIAKKGLIADENQMQEENAKSSKVTIASDGAIVCDSIVQGVRDSELANGTYTFRVTGKVNGTSETKNYKVELINYYDDVTYSLMSGQTSRTISLGDSTKEYKMLVVKYHKNLTINSGVTVTATAVSNLTYKKGMYLCVMGELKNSGTISMTARGTYNQAGENVYLWKNRDNSYEYVPAIGGAGGASVSTSSSGWDWSVAHGKGGINGSNRRTGGGGSGASTNYNSTGNSGAGGAGTSYSGGAGGGSQCGGAKGQTAGSGSSIGGAGGQGYCRVGNTYDTWKNAGGGAGNIGGAGWEASKDVMNGHSVTDSRKGQNGTGGLLIIYANEISNYGSLKSEGSNGGKGIVGDHCTSGGSSGGGSINVFYGNKIVGSTNYSISGGIAVSTTGDRPRRNRRIRRSRKCYSNKNNARFKLPNKRNSTKYK